METQAIEIKVGTGVTYCGWTDRRAFEVVEVRTERKLMIRRMKATRDFIPERVPGGFFGHCMQEAPSDQKWILESDLTQAPIAIRLNKRGEWKDATGARYTVGRAVEFYDFNF